MQYEDEIVYQIDMSKSDEEIKQQMEANEMAKLRHAARKEQERFDRESLFEKATRKIKALFALKNAQKQQIQNNDKQR